MLLLKILWSSSGLLLFSDIGASIEPIIKFKNFESLVNKYEYISGCENHYQQSFLIWTNGNKYSKSNKILNICYNKFLQNFEF